MYVGCERSLDLRHMSRQKLCELRSLRSTKLDRPSKTPARLPNEILRRESAPRRNYRLKTTCPIHSCWSDRRNRTLREVDPWDPQRSHSVGVWPNLAPQQAAWARCGGPKATHLSCSRIQDHRNGPVRSHLPRSHRVRLSSTVLASHNSKTSCRHNRSSRACAQARPRGELHRKGCGRLQALNNCSSVNTIADRKLNRASSRNSHTFPGSIV